MMKRCEIKMGLMRGREIQDMIEAAINAPCPCKIGNRCPLTPVGSHSWELRTDDGEVAAV